MFQNRNSVLTSLFIFTILSLPLRADEKATNILNKVESLYLGDSTEIKMKIQEPDGTLKERDLLLKRKKESDLKILIKILSPAEMKGAGLLCVVAKDSKPKQWYYSPSEKSSRLLTEANKKDRFLDSEFNFEDLSFAIYKDFSHSVGETKKEGDITTTVIESSSKKLDDTIYSKIKTWVDTTHNRLMKVEYYDEDANLLKVMTLSQYKKHEHLWLAQNITINNVKKNRITTLQLSNIKSKKMLDSDFSIKALEEP